MANATIQQRLVPVRLSYDFLIEEGLRESNPVGRGRYTPGRKFGGYRAGRLTEEDRRGLSPLFWSHINPYGRFRLDMDTRLDLTAA